MGEAESGGSESRGCGNGALFLAFPIEADLMRVLMRIFGNVAAATELMGSDMICQRCGSDMICQKVWQCPVN